MVETTFRKDIQYYKFSAYGFLKNLRFFEPFLILFFLEKGLLFFQIGLLYSLREIVRNLLEIPSGMLADTAGRKNTMVVSFLFYIVSFIVFYLSTSFGLLILAMVLFSFGDAFRTGTHKAMIFDYLQIRGWEKFTVGYYGHTRSWSQMGSAISSVLAALIVFYTGQYRQIFLFSVLPYLLDMLLMLTYPSELNGPVKDFTWRAMVKAFTRVFTDFIQALKSLKLIVSILNTSSFSGYFRSMKDYLQPVIQSLAVSLPFFILLEEKERTALLVGLVYFVIFLLTAISSRVSGIVSKRFIKRSFPLNLTLYTGFVIGILAGIFYRYGFFLLAILFYILIYMVENLRKPMGISYVAGMLDRKIMASALSAESQVKTIFSVMIALFLGFMADSIGIGTSLIVVSILMLLVSLLFRVRE